MSSEAEVLIKDLQGNLIYIAAEVPLSVPQNLTPLKIHNIERLLTTLFQCITSFILSKSNYDRKRFIEEFNRLKT